MGKSCKVLIIDDEKDFCELLKENLSLMDEFEVAYETDPQKAEAAVEREAPDIILLDNVMPNRKGSEIVHALRRQEKTKGIPIIMISGRGEMVFYKKTASFKWEANRPIVKNRGQISDSKNPDSLAQEYGVDCYISKPVTTDIIIEAMKDLLKARGKIGGAEGGEAAEF